MKKLFSLMLCLLLIISMATTALATGEDPADGNGESGSTTTELVTLTIQGEKSGHEYEAYQIFSGKLTATGIMTEIMWGSGIEDGADLLEQLKDGKYQETFAGAFVKAEDAKGVADAMKADWGDGPKLRLFADIVSKNLSSTYYPSTESTGNKYTFTLEPGYYLIKDKDGTVDNEHDFYTKFIVNVTTATDIKVKGNVPYVTKEVSEILKDGYTSEITNQLNRPHYYMWTGHIPSDIQDYDFYYYKFVDTLSEGLDFLQIEQIYIQLKDGDIEEIYDITKHGDNSKITTATNYAPDNVDLTVDHEKGDHTISLEWLDLKAKYPNLLSSDKIIVKYSAQLNENAVIGHEGNPNTVELYFSNNPNDEDAVGKTPPVGPRVYSFALEILKIDETTKNLDEKIYLEGAEFVLYHYHTVKRETDETDGDSESGASPNSTNVEMYAIVDSNNKITGWTEDQDQATRLTTDSNGRILVEGLMLENGYYLREITPPTGYNSLPADVKIVITSYDTDSNNTVTKITYEVDSTKFNVEDNAEEGVITTTISNKKGTTLSSTGGMGTTILYTAGGIMVLAAVVLLVTKKRMANAD